VAPDHEGRCGAKRCAWISKLQQDSHFGSKKLTNAVIIMVNDRPNAYFSEFFYRQEPDFFLASVLLDINGKVLEVPVMANIAFMPAPTSSTSVGLDLALEVVEAMSHAGLVSIPVKPSVAMLTAGARAGDVSIEVVWRIYQSMLSAA
jgi:hypothetical protein